jgi:hypothetical protein
MAARKVEDLRALRNELVERRRQEAYGVSGAQHHDRIEKLVQVHLAIEALDAVIEEGKDAPETDVNSMIGGTEATARNTPSGSTGL